ECQQRPRGLARDRRAPSGQLGSRVALAGLAPAAVGILVADEPAHRSLDELLARIGADRGEPAQPRPRAVDLQPPPAAVPGAVVALGAADAVERAIPRLEVEAVAQHAEQLETAPGQVFGGWIEERAV